MTVGFYRGRNASEFKLKGEHTQLSTDVLVEVNGYERLESEGDVPQFYIKADRAITFADNHQELENAFIQVYDRLGETSDRLTADKAIYIPEQDKNFTAYLAGNVQIETRDDLKVNTNHITYTRANETAEADEGVTFERNGVKGKSFGAIVRVAQKELELLRDVEIETFRSPELAGSDISEARMTAGHALVNQAAERIDLGGQVTVNMVGKDASRNADVRADRAAAYFTGQNDDNPQLVKIELFDSVHIETAESGGKPTKMASGYAMYDRPADRFELKQGVHIITIDDDTPVNIRSGEAVYEQAKGNVHLTGGAEIAQLNSLIKGDIINAVLWPSKKVKSAQVKSNAYLKQSAPDKVTEVSGTEMNAAFDQSQLLSAAGVTGQSSATLVPTSQDDYSRVTFNAQRSISLALNGGRTEKMETQGRTTIHMQAPANTPDASNKTITADTVRTFFRDGGDYLRKAEAIGNAELEVIPLQAAAANYRTKINAPRFDCEFLATGNNVKSCDGGVKTITVRTPTVPAHDRGVQTLSADRLHASFNPGSRDVEHFRAVGSAKFSERDRNATAGEFVFAQSDRVVRLRNGEPTVWDSKARAKAEEIDWDTANERSFLRGRVSTTYYSQKQTDGAVPFSDENDPVYITSNTAEFDHGLETAAYAGNARGWQGNNYVRGEKFLIDQKKGQFYAEGSVQSLLYRAKQVEGNGETSVPVYAAADRMLYARDNRLLRYESNVDIRQGTDRISSAIANVFLDERYEVSQTIAETNVIITQPNRRAAGDYAQYIAADQSVILRGSPATISDSENGSSQGAQVTVHLRDNRVVGGGKTKQNTAGRIRSVYKVKNQ